MKLPKLRGSAALILLSAAMVLGVWQGITVALAMRVDGSSTAWKEPLVWEVTGTLAAAACIWLPMTAVLNARGRPCRFVMVHLAAYAMYVAMKNPLMLGQRYLLYRALHWGHYGYSYSAPHLAMEAMKDALGYAIMAAAYSLFRASRERHARELREARLAAELRESRLQALSAQLDPHFLLNALNTISSVMFEDLAKTDRLLADLGVVLRAGFDAGTATWSLGAERAHTERFVALLEARFDDRLRVAWDISAELHDITVPRFALQLLVENAVKHNQDRTAPLSVAVRARETGDQVQLEVEDTGRGFGSASPASHSGRGLRHLDEILGLLYGPRATMTRSSGAEGGARVTITLPSERVGPT